MVFGYGGAFGPTSIGYNGKMFIVLNSRYSSETIQYSYDGIYWSNANNQPISWGMPIPGKSIGWNGDYWVLGGAGGRGLGYSRDGINWLTLTSGGFFGPADGDYGCDALAWNGQYWLAGGYSTDDVNIQVSADTSNWTSTLNGSNFMNGYTGGIARSIVWDGTNWFITLDNNKVLKSGLDTLGNFIWITVISNIFPSGYPTAMAYNTPQLPYLQNTNFAMYQRTNIQPLYDTLSNNFIKTNETSFNINNTLYVNVSTIASTNVTYFNSKVGIFQQNPSFSLELLHDSAYKPGSNRWTNTSDRRVKENIQEANLEICASTIATLSLRNFSFVSSFANITGISQEQHYGLIAQEVQEAQIPHTVTKKPGYGYEDFHYLNIDQIEYIHMATTQYLIGKMSTQQSTIDGLLLQI